VGDRMKKAVATVGDSSIVNRSFLKTGSAAIALHHLLIQKKNKNETGHYSHSFTHWSIKCIK